MKTKNTPTLKPRDGLSRRNFAKGALLATAAAVAPREAAARTSTLGGGQSNQQGPVPPVVEAQMQALLGKYGSRLSEEQKADCKRLLVQAQKGAEAIRAFPLDNADAPAASFRVYRKDRA
ncbi:MAG: hypothetical protein DMF61_19910 [Blastocatellia bacterium AA13]|nr:MAG: hypothetical protein DMF61_19910 [Blastocatellia bacterium AA13]